MEFEVPLRYEGMCWYRIHCSCCNLKKMLGHWRGKIFRRRDCTRRQGLGHAAACSGFRGRETSGCTQEQLGSAELGLTEAGCREQSRRVSTMSSDSFFTCSLSQFRNSVPATKLQFQRQFSVMPCFVMVGSWGRMHPDRPLGLRRTRWAQSRMGGFLSAHCNDARQIIPEATRLVEWCTVSQIQLLRTS